MTNPSRSRVLVDVAPAAYPLVLTGCVVIVYWALLSPLGFRTHDFFWPYLRVAQYAADFAAGRLPQVLPYGALGAGYAYPFFYPPLGHWIAAGLTLATNDAMLGVNLAYLLSVVLSALAMYHMLLTISCRRWAALVGALAYSTVPYRFVDIFVRGALTESWTFLWYPLVVTGAWQVMMRRVFPWYLPVALAGLVLTHNITAVYFLAFYVILAACAWAWCGRGAAARLGGALVLAAGLALWFVLPQQHYLPTVWASDRAYEWADVAHVSAHRVMLGQLFDPRITSWWGISYAVGKEDGMSFFLGATQLFMGFVVLLLLGRALRPAPREESEDRLRWRLLILFATAWIALLVFMVQPAPFLSVLPGSFAYIQFPWRLLGLTAFFGTAALGIFFSCADLPRFTRRLLLGTAIVLALLVPPFERGPSPVRSSKEFITPRILLQEGRTGYMIQGEFLPRQIIPFQIERYLLRAPVLAEGIGSVAAWRRTPAGGLASVASAGATIVFPLIFYPFYEVRDARGTTLRPVNRGGLLAAQVPAGSTRLVVSQTLAPATRVGLVGSVLSCLALAVLAVGSRRFQR